MNIKILAVGKIREKYLKTGIDEFLKRIQPYSSIQVFEISPDNPDIETEKILKQLGDNSYFIVLDIKGKHLSSENFAEKIKEISLSGVNQLVFAIGGADGLSNEVRGKADFLLSMSSMTFPHQMARLMLIEQVYRAFRIINNEPYHK